MTSKAKHLAQQLENGVLVILWREINPDCGNKCKCYIMGHEISSMEVTGPRGEEFTNAHTENPFICTARTHMEMQQGILRGLKPLEDTYRKTHAHYKHTYTKYTCHTHTHTH